MDISKVMDFFFVQIIDFLSWFFEKAPYVRFEILNKLNKLFSQIIVKKKFERFAQIAFCNWSIDQK